MTDHMAAVERGVAVLDREVPGWIFTIDLDTLDLSDTGYCVLGQIFTGGFWEGMRSLFGPEATVENAVLCGFEVGFDEDLEDEDSDIYDGLTEAWISLIDNRLADAR